MDMRGTTDAVRSGWTGIAAGPLLILSSGIELVHPVQEGDGTVVEPVSFLGLVALWVLGMVCVAATVLETRNRHLDAGTPLPRTGRVGVRLLIAGCALQVAFAALSGISAALTGKPVEAAFLLYALGFLSLVTGGVLLGLGVRRAGVLRPAAVPLWLGAASAFGAIAVVSDPWHDLALFGFDATWIGLGATLLRQDRLSATVGPQRRVTVRA